MTDKQLFAEIKIGMSRVDVENVLGKPVLEVGNEVHYG
jgi:outer membrane protein assembly factor BamE (lipoprotein component of BamABCDE complex)